MKATLTIYYDDGNTYIFQDDNADDLLRQINRRDVGLIKTNVHNKEEKTKKTYIFNKKHIVRCEMVEYGVETLEVDLSGIKL